MSGYDDGWGVSNNNRPNHGNWNNNRNQNGGNRNWNNNRGGNGGGNRNWQRNSKPFDPDNVKLYKPYVVVSNKEVPEEVKAKIAHFVKLLEATGYMLRVDGMEGLGAHLEEVPAKDNIEVHLPWRGFDNKESKFYFNTDEAKALAKIFTSGYDALKPVVQSFLAKNVRVMMGDKLKSPALFMICYSEDGAENGREKSIKTGNIGNLITIATALKIPVFNFGKQDAEQRLQAYMAVTEKQEEPREQVNHTNSNFNSDF